MGPPDTPSTRYQRSLAASRELAEAQRATAQTAERRVTAEVALGERRRELHRLSSFGPSTWWPRLRGQLADRQNPVNEQVRAAEVDVTAAEAAHKAAVVHLLLVQRRADDLPAAREAAVAALSGSESESAHALLAEANELAKALFAAQAAHVAAIGVKAELSTASGLSTYDTFLGGGMTASLVKQDSFYEADEASHSLTSLLAELRSELQNLEVPTAYFGIQMNDLTASLDVFPDNIISDWTMDRRVRDARERVQCLVDGLDRLMALLGQRRIAALEKLDALIAQGGRSA